MEEDEYEFYYDLDRMKYILENNKKSYRVPKELKTAEEILDWMMSVKVEPEDKEIK